MAKQFNEFTKIVRTTHARLATINFLASNSDKRTKTDVERAGESEDILKRHFDKDDFAGGTLLLGRNAYNDPPTYARYGWGKVTVKDICALAVELGGLFQAHCLTMAFEAVEKMIKEFGVEWLWQKRGQVALAKKKGFEKKRLERRDVKENTPAYFSLYIDFLCGRNCNDLLKLMTQKIPKMKELKTTPAWGISVWDTFSVVSDCRHAIIHCSGILGEDTCRGLDKQQREKVKALQSDSVALGKKAILPSYNVVKDYLAVLGDLGYGM